MITQNTPQLNDLKSKNHKRNSLKITPSHDTNYSAYHCSETIKFVSGEGIYLQNDKGDRYLDACAGTFNISLGYKHPEILEALQTVLDNGLFHVSSSFDVEIVKRAEAALVRIAPDNLDSCHLKGCTGGSTSIEQAIRHAWANTDKRTIVSFRGGHHGQTIATTFLSGMPFRRNRLPSGTLPVVHVDSPDCYRCPFNKNPSTCNLECIEPIERSLDFPPTGEDDIAAFIAEPILGAGGGITPPKKFWQELQERLKRRGILLVFDEVQTFGRTGHFFAAQYYDVMPNMIAVAKGISGIGIPSAGALLMESNLASLKSCERSLTWGANLFTSKAISSTIEIMSEPFFMTRVKNSGEVLAERLAKIKSKFDFIGTVRGIGLMTGIEIVKTPESKVPDSKLANQIVKEAMKHKLLLRTSEYGRGGFVKIRPSLVISSEEIHDLCDRLEYTLSSVLN